ncbi:MAG: hypothetical protein SFY92_03345 [Verrucomicrobiae bacterium]|nr:hypothetical protein [Verrucomicrobiae bacterium]
MKSLRSVLLPPLLALLLSGCETTPSRHGRISGEEAEKLARRGGFIESNARCEAATWSQDYQCWIILVKSPQSQGAPLTQRVVVSANGNDIWTESYGPN